MLHPISSVELYLPWNDTWLELPPLPGDGQGQRITDTHIFSLNANGGLGLNLLGGVLSLSSGGEVYTNHVWQLMWTNSSYYWTDELFPPMGELHY